MREIREKNNLLLAERLKKKRQDKLNELKRLKEEEERIAKQRMFLGAAKAMMESKRFNDQRKGAEREARTRQDVKQTVYYYLFQEADIDQQTKLLEDYERMKNGVNIVKTKKEINRKREIQNKNDIKAMTARERSNRIDRYYLTETERNTETIQLQTRKDKDVYGTMISTKDITMGKEFTKKQSLRQTGASVLKA